MIAFTCPKCQHQLTRHDNEAGSKILCPSYGQRLQVPPFPRLADNTIMGELAFPHSSGRVTSSLGEASAQPVQANVLRFRFRCPYCGACMRIGVHKAGATVDCPKCQRAIQVPVPTADMLEPHRTPALPSSPTDLVQAATENHTSELSRKPPKAHQNPIAGELISQFDDNPAVHARKSYWRAILGALGVTLVLAITGVLLWKFFLAPSGIGEELKYLPEDCHLLASINVQGILDSELYKELRGVAPTFEKDFENSNGIPLAKVKRATMGVSFGGDGGGVLILKMNTPVTASDARSGRKVWGYQKNFRFEEIQVGRHTIYEEVYDNDFLKG